MNYKRKKSRRNVRCQLCTKHRWRGNGAARKSVRDLRAMQREE